MGIEHDHPEPKPKAAKPELKLTAAEPFEDTGTQALSEALRSSFVLIKAAMLLLTIYFCCSNFFVVKQSERAVVLRFGKPVGVGQEALKGPGLHLAWPYPIDEVVKIPSAQVLSARSTVGWYAVDPRQPAGAADTMFRPTLNPAADGYLLTGDGNILHVQATLRYSVTDSLKYYFGFTNAAEMVTNSLNNALFYAAARFTVDDALRRNLAAFQETVANRIEDLVRGQDLGITVQQVDLVPAAPRQVKAAFDEVTAAENERSTKINAAQGYANEVLAKAQGEAKARINAGETARTRLVEEVQAEARYFTDLLPSYEKDPGLFARRLQVEYLSRVMTNAQDKFFLPMRADGKPRELRLQLNREPQKLATPLTPPQKADHSH